MRCALVLTGLLLATITFGPWFDADGTLYVIDSLQNQIRVFDREGNPIATWGERGSTPGQFRFEDPDSFWGDLVVGPDGNLDVGSSSIRGERRWMRRAISSLLKTAVIAFRSLPL